jgi:hypothetical protein
MLNPLHSLEQSWCSKRAAYLAILLALCFVSAFGQNEAGRISGKITDPSGAVVIGATVTVTALEVSLERDATTDERGFYHFKSLRPGLYELTVQAKGFARWTLRAQVIVGTVTTVNASLALTPVKVEETVIGSGGVQVNTQNQQLSDVISGRQVRELPTITRDPSDLVSLSGNVTPVTARNGVNATGIGTTTSRGINYSINGQQPTGNNIQLDGGELSNSFQTEVAQQFPLDSVQEIIVLTNSYLPDYGRATGGIIALATRQGGNAFHGSAFSFARNRSFSSNSFNNNANGIEKGHLVANQFGYSIGGPIRRDRLYFFNSTEGNLVRSREDRIALVPAPELIASSAPATQHFFNAFPLGTPINGRVFTVAEIKALMGQTGPASTTIVLPQNLPAFGQVRYSTLTDVGAGQPQDSLMTLTRIDHHFNERIQTYGRYAYEFRDFYSGTFSSSPYQGFNSGSGAVNHSVLLNWSNAVSSKWGYNTKLSFNRFNVMRQLGVQPASPRLLATSAGSAKLGGYSILLPGYLPLAPDIILPFTGPLNLLHVNQDVDVALGNHQFKFGGGYFYTQDNRTIGAYQNAPLTLGAGLPQALNNLLMGQASTFATTINPGFAQPGETIPLPVKPASFGRSAGIHDFALYFNDSWRISPRLNLNLGVRYDFFSVPNSLDMRIQSNFFFGKGVNFFEHIANGTVDNPAGKFYEQEWDNVGPRFGFAWDIFGSGRTSLRGGYGLTYQRPQGSPSLSTFLNPPNIGVVALTARTVGVKTIPITTNNLGPLGGGAGTATLPPLALNALPSNYVFKTARTHFWSLALEHEFLPNIVALVQYAGATGRDLYAVSNINLPSSGAVYLGASNPLARLNPQYAAIYWISKDGRSNYNALIAGISSSNWRNLGLVFSGRYRYAQALDNLGSFPTHNLNRGLLDPVNPGLDYGPADFDVRHRFTGNFSWEVPFEKLTGSFAKAVFGGWQLAGILEFRSGSPYTVFNCANAGSAESTCPHLLVKGTVRKEGAGDTLPDPAIPNRFVFADLSEVNAGSFTHPVTGTSDFGPYPANMLGRNFFRGPGFWNVDAGIYKRFQLWEGFDLQFRAEFYNLFNHANLFVGGAVDINSTNYVAAYRDGRRQIQLGLKLTF